MSHSKFNSRTVSIFSSKVLELYCVKIEWLNDFSDKEFREPVNSSQLLYNNQREEKIQISRVTDHENKIRKQCIAENALVLMSIPVQYVDNVVINIQLPYNLDHPTEPELWDENFHSILFHGSIEYFSFNSKNIKESLN